MGSQHDSALARRNEDVCQDEIKLQVCLSKQKAQEMYASEKYSRQKENRIHKPKYTLIKHRKVYRPD